jgi:hypothetical protein
MINCSIGDLLCIRYGGQYIVKGGKYQGKTSHIWKVLKDMEWTPTPEFVGQLQQEVQARRLEVQRMLSQSQGKTVNTQRPMQNNTQMPPVQQNTALMAQYAPQTVTQSVQPSQNPFLNPYAPKATNPFG